MYCLTCLSVLTLYHQTYFIFFFLVMIFFIPWKIVEDRVTSLNVCSTRIYHLSADAFRWFPVAEHFCPFVQIFPPKAVTRHFARVSNTLTFSQSLRMTWSTCMTLWSARLAHVVSDVQPDASTGLRPTLGPLPCPKIHLAHRAKERGLPRHPGHQDEQHRLHEQPRPPKPNLKATNYCPTSEQNSLIGLWLRPHPLS